MSSEGQTEGVVGTSGDRCIMGRFPCLAGLITAQAQFEAQYETETPSDSQNHQTCLHTAASEHIKASFT